MKRLIWCSLLFALLFLAGCEDNRLSLARSQYQRGRYAAAIESYDNYIQISENGAKVTYAELERGECYYQLGQKAAERKRWDLAARFFFLSNLPKADNELDNCYYQLAAQAYEQGDYPTVYDDYGKIIEFLPNSELIPEILYHKIDMLIRLNHDQEEAWSVYALLCDKYPKDEYVKRAQPMIDAFMPILIDEAVALKDTRGFEPALERLFSLESYPTAFKETIYLRISEMYMNLAESNIATRDYLKAVRNFRSAIDYDPQKESQVKRRLNEICGLFVSKGDELLAQRKIDEAILNYQGAFTIIPDYAPAQEGVRRAETTRENIRQSQALLAQALTAEQSKKYTTALELYRQAYALDRLDATQKKVFEMTNQVQIEKDPIGFARQILREYQGGMIIRRVQALVDKNVLTYGSNVSTQDWRYLLSVGEAKYEARYDITTPDKSYYLDWLINLRDRSVTPLNKASEDLSQ
jgi:hypothetical protein